MKLIDLTQEKTEICWSGEGLPPVGAVCEFTLNGGVSWFRCRIEYVVGCQGVVMSCDVPDSVQFVNTQKRETRFRPIRTPEQIEAERKRERVIMKMLDAWNLGGDGTSQSVCNAIYDAIRDGKIKGVKIDA
jgi:hypothetical protein